MNYWSWISSIFSNLSSPLTYVGLLSAVLISLTILKAPQSLINFFQLNSIYIKITPWAGLTLLASSSTLISLGIVEFVKKVGLGLRLAEYYRAWEEKKDLKRKIDTLSLEQQKVLARFKAKDTNSIQFLPRSVREVEFLSADSQEYLAELDDMVNKGFLNSADSIGVYSINPRVKEIIEKDLSVLEKANVYYAKKRKEKAKEEVENG